MCHSNQKRKEGSRKAGALAWWRYSGVGMLFLKFKKKNRFQKEQCRRPILEVIFLIYKTSLKLFLFRENVLWFLQESIINVSVPMHKNIISLGFRLKIILLYWSRNNIPSLDLKFHKRRHKRFRVSFLCEQNNIGANRKIHKYTVYICCR